MAPPGREKELILKDSNVMRCLMPALVVLACLGYVRPVAATSITFNTSDSQFTPGVDNQGFWSATFANTTTNDNYFTGELASGAVLRSFFTFDLSSLDLTDQTVTGATLELSRHLYDSTDASEIIRLFDVSTPAATLNDHTGTSASIFNDLGSGTIYGTFGVNDYTGTPTLSTLTFVLTAAALADISAAAGNFFSIGGALISISPGEGENEAIFSGSSGAGIQRLIVETTPIPEPASILLFGTGIAGLIVTRARRRRG